MKYDHDYQAIVYNGTYQDMNQTGEFNGTLRKKDPFWDQILTALEHCKDHTVPMQFWHNDVSFPRNATRPRLLTFVLSPLSLYSVRYAMTFKSLRHFTFVAKQDGEKQTYISFRKLFKNNGSEIHIDVEELYMQEKADLEYSFNWAVDMNWRIFATVLGICMPNYEKAIPLISARFYALYSQDFLHPLRQIW